MAKHSRSLTAVQQGDLELLLNLSKALHLHQQNWVTYVMLNEIGFPKLLENRKCSINISVLTFYFLLFSHFLALALMWHVHFCPSIVFWVAVDILGALRYGIIILEDFILKHVSSFSTSSKQFKQTKCIKAFTLWHLFSIACEPSHALNRKQKLQKLSRLLGGTI